MPKHRRGWGRIYGAGERLPDIDPTPPEDSDEPADPHDHIPYPGILDVEAVHGPDDEQP